MKTDEKIVEEINECKTLKQLQDYWMNTPKKYKNHITKKKFEERYTKMIYYL